MQQDRIKKMTKGGYPSFNQSITGIKTSTELKPALQVKQNSRLMGKGSFYGSSALPSKLPPMGKDSQKRREMEESPNKSSFIANDAYAYDDLNASSYTAIPSKFLKFKFDSD